MKKIWVKRFESFKQADEERKNQLRRLSLAEALKIEEALLSSTFVWARRRKFLIDSPVSLKIGLKGKK